MFLKLLILVKNFVKYFNTYKKYFYVETNRILDKEEAFGYFLPIYINNIYIYAYEKVPIDDAFFRNSAEDYAEGFDPTATGKNDLTIKINDRGFNLKKPRDQQIALSENDKKKQILEEKIENIDKDFWDSIERLNDNNEYRFLVQDMWSGTTGKQGQADDRDCDGGPGGGLGAGGGGVGLGDMEIDEFMGEAYGNEGDYYGMERDGESGYDEYSLGEEGGNQRDFWESKDRKKIKVAFVGVGGGVTGGVEGGLDARNLAMEKIFGTDSESLLENDQVSFFFAEINRKGLNSRANVRTQNLAWAELCDRAHWAGRQRLSKTPLESIPKSAEPITNPSIPTHEKRFSYICH